VGGYYNVVSQLSPLGVALPLDLGLLVQSFECLVESK